MIEEPVDGLDVPSPTVDGPAVASAELVVRERRSTALPARRLPRAAVRLRGRVVQLRGRVVELRQHPAAVASVSAAATLGSAVLVTGLRRALQHAAVSPRARTTSVAVGGYILHEVHVIHHVVHHVRHSPEN